MRDGDVLYESLIGLSADGSPGHTTRLLGEVEAAAEAAGGWEGVEALAVGVGPGSFTGLRVGMASARGIAASLGIEMRGVCTLDALARGLDDAVDADGLDRLALIDARRGEVFAALYTPSGERVWEPWVGDPGALAERLSTLAEAPLAAGSGALRFRHELLAGRGVRIADGDEDLHRVAARHVCGLAAAGEADAEPLAPIYLRPPDAERWHGRDHPKRSE